MSEPFYFYTQFHLVQLLGLRAKNAEELLDGLQRVPASSLYYHTHRFLQEHHYLSPEPPNDFAYWLTNILNANELGERFASVDVIRFRDIEDLRVAFAGILEDELARKKRRADCPEGHEFQFMSCRTFCMPLGLSASTPEEFSSLLETVDVHSLYFHMFEARLRHGRDENDFSSWFKSLGKEKLAKEISNLDPYTMTLEGLRKKILKLIKKHD